MLRMSLYGFVFIMFTCSVLLVQFCLNNSDHLLSDGSEHVGTLFARFFTEQCVVMLAFSLFIVPLICIDMLQLSHRFAGPLVRFESALNKMKQGEIVEPIKLRDGDLVEEFNQVMNEFIEVHNARLAQLNQNGTKNAENDQEQTVLEEINQQKELVQAGTEGANSLS